MKKGKKCPSCGQVNVQGAFQCGKCGSEIDKVELKLYETHEFEIVTKNNSHVSGDSQSDNDYTKVVVTDIRMPFESMVVFLVKLAIAAIPAFIILSYLFIFLSTIFASIIARL